MASQADAPCSGTVSRRRLLISFAAVLALHLGLLSYYAPPRVMLSTTPVHPIDYSLHYYQVDRAIKAFSSSGRLWGYDPHVLAGQPAGAVEDLSSKSVELFVIALKRLGVDPGLAFNLYLLLVHLLVPFVGYAVGRLFSLAPLRAVLVALLWVLLWFFDSFIHWSWYCGMISWALSSYLIVLLVALLHRTLEMARAHRGHPSERPADGPVPSPGSMPAAILGAPAIAWIGLAALAALCMLVHPFALAALFLPCLGLYLRALRQLRWPQHLSLWAAVAAATFTSLVWLVPALQLRHYIMDSTSFLKPTPLYVLFDYLDLLLGGLDTGAPVRTMLRVLCFVAAGYCFVRWRRERDPRLLPLGLLLLGTLFWAYFGGVFWISKQMQPHRHIAPAALASAIPAAILLAEIFSRESLRQLDRRGRFILVLAIVLVVPRFAHTVLYYIPELVPRSSTDLPGLMLQGNLPSGIVGLNEPRPYRLGHAPHPPAFERVRRWLMANHQGRGRIVVENYELGEYLAWSTDLPILGGLVERNVPHVDAHLFRRNPEGALPGDELRAYFERYAVGFVVVSTIRRKLEWRRDLLRFKILLEPIRIYETLPEPSYFAEGRGRIARQAFNTIAIADAAGPQVVLRFHWMETLRCRPRCRVQRHPVSGDRVGFIRVREPPRAFEIYNSYDF